MKKRYRYPGSKPFDSSEQDIFFGREQDIIALTKFIELEQSVVIYGKSGIGKSSLIEAGIIPEILKKGHYHPIRIRFGAYTKGKAETPVQIARDTINIEEDTWLKDIQTETEQSLWYTIKNRQIQEKHKGYLLVFDQFEELFTYPDELVKSFARQLAEILYTNIPERFRQGIEAGFSKNDNFLSDAQMQQLHQPIDLKILMGIRSDRMSLMNKLKPFLPVVLLNTHEILPLTRLQAEDAILSPAYKEDKKFVSRRFDFDDNALDAILDFLTQENTQNVESFQLQILCHHIEQIIIDEKDKKKVSISDIEDIPSIYQNYYLDQIKRLGSKSNQNAARRLIEDGLIYEEEERRLSLYESQIYKYYDISQKLLRRLVDTHIIRAEPSMRGGYTYELSHDTLVVPVIRAKKRRITGNSAKRTTEDRPKSELKTQRYSLIKLLNAFSEKELSELTLFVECEYFNTDYHLITLLNVLKNEVIHREQFTIDKQVTVYRKAFPNRPIPDEELNRNEMKYLRNKMNLLRRLTEDFLKQIALEEHTVYNDELLFKKLLEKKQFSLFNRHIKRNKKIQQKESKGRNYYENQFKTELAILEYLNINSRLLLEDNLKEVNYNIDLYYVLNKLRLYTTATYLQNFTTKKSYDFSSQKAIEPLLLLPQYKNHPLVLIYQATIELEQLKNETNFYKLLELLHKYDNYIPHKDLTSFYLAAINFCTYQLRAGKINYYRRVFELFKLMDEKNLLIEDNHISIGKLKNIITVSCEVEEFKWAEQLAEKYIPFVTETFRHSVRNFIWGSIAFHQNDYNTALSHFIRVERVDLSIDIDVRIMLLKSYYELDKEYYERTLQIMLSFKKFIRNQKNLTSIDKKAYANFIQILINIYRRRHNVNTTVERIKMIKDRLESQKVNSDKKWLLKKIEELKKTQ